MEHLAILTRKWVDLQGVRYLRLISEDRCDPACHDLNLNVLRDRDRTTAMTTRTASPHQKRIGTKHIDDSVCLSDKKWHSLCYVCHLHNNLLYSLSLSKGYQMFIN